MSKNVGLVAQFPAESNPSVSAGRVDGFLERSGRCGLTSARLIMLLQRTTHRMGVSRARPILMNAQFLFLKMRVGQFIWVHSPSNELPYSLFRIVVIQHSARLVHFKTIKKNRHRLPNHVGILKKELRATVAAVVRTQISGDE